MREGANLPWLRCQATDSSEQGQRASCEPLTAIAERVSDNCLGTQHPALSPADSRGRAGRHDLAADRIGAVQGTVRYTLLPYFSSCLS